MKFAADVLGRAALSGQSFFIFGDFRTISDIGRLAGDIEDITFAGRARSSL
jgi:hypothetical protein